MGHNRNEYMYKCTTHHFWYHMSRVRRRREYSHTNTSTLNNYLQGKEKSRRHLQPAFTPIDKQEGRVEVITPRPPNFIMPTNDDCSPVVPAHYEADLIH